MNRSKYIGSLVLKIAERCNLNCSYCYMYNHVDQSYLARPKFMSDATYDVMLERVKSFCMQNNTQMVLCYHGGEPTLVGVDKLRKFARKTREYLGDYLGGLKIQTNATLIDENWARMLKEERIGVGVSLDGPAEINDHMRVDHAGRGSHARVVQGIEHLKHQEMISSVLCVINPAHSGLAAYRHFRDLGFKRLVFLLPDISHDSKENWYGGMGETPVADYLIPIFDEWFQRDEKDVRVYPFWDIFTMLKHGECTSDTLGNPNLGYVIIETDGAIHPLDVFRVCEEGMIETGLNVHTHGFEDLSKGSPLLYEMLKDGLPLSETCRKCEEVEICGGGYVPHRYKKENGFDNPSAWCADLKKLLNHVYEKIGSYAV